LNSAAQILNMAGRFSEAESYAREALALEDRNHLAEGDGRRASSLCLLASSLRDRHKAQEAIPLLERALGIYGRDPSQATGADKVRRMLAEMRSKTARPTGGR
jgi:tetratricopeptide (TPR) repeat protein